jgi:nickel/cobalt exporter
VTVVGADATLDVSERLTRYPDDLLRQPLNERVAALSLNPGGPDLEPWSATDAWPVDRSGADAPTGAVRTETAIPGGVSGELPAIIDLRNLSLPVAGLGLVLAVIAGAGHAVSPGHGKTVMAAYLLGSRGGTRQAILLGGLVTISHTVGVLLLAVVVLVAGEVLPPERLYPVLTLVSGTTVVLIGAALLIGCIRRLRSPVGRTHAHGDGAHRHGLRVHTHGHSSNPSWRGLAALGIAGGLVPSTSALILLLAAVGAGQPTYGLALAVAFGIGMATVLTGIGLALVHGRTVVGRLGSDRPRLALAGAAIPWLTAVMVIGGGVVLTGQALIVSL